MIIQNKFDQNSFANANLAVLYSKPITKLLTYLSAFLLFIFIITIAGTSDGSYTSLFVPICMLLILPVNVYFSSRRTYKNNAVNRETMEYHITPDFLLIKGESFETKLQWEIIRKITKKWGWILIWHNSQIANAIPKEKLSQHHLSEIKSIMKTNHIKGSI